MPRQARLDARPHRLKAKPTRLLTPARSNGGQVAGRPPASYNTSCLPGEIHKVTALAYFTGARGIERREIFKDDKDRELFLGRLAIVLDESQTQCYAWALIPNHFHLLLRTGPVLLSHVMRRLMTGYAVTFNKRHKRSGHLFQNRYKSTVCEEDAYLLELIRYIHLNPLRASLVNDL